MARGVVVDVLVVSVTVVEVLVVSVALVVEVAVTVVVAHLPYAFTPVQNAWQGDLNTCPSLLAHTAALGCEFGLQYVEMQSAAASGEESECREGG